MADTESNADFDVEVDYRQATAARVGDNFPSAVT